MSGLSSQDKILLVVNPIAGGTDKTVYVDKVKSFLANSCELEIYSTTDHNDSTKIRALIEKIKPVRILVMGGDGTIKLITEIVHNNIPMGILPAGSSNGLAKDLHLPLDMESALEVSLSKNVKYIDTLCINDHLGLHISDVGLNAELIQRFSTGNIRGHYGYALNVLPTLIESEMPFRFTVKANGVEKEVEAVMIAFANSQNYGTGISINPNGIVDDGFFEVLIFKNLDAISVFKTIMGMIDFSSDFVEVIKTKEVTVRSEKPVYFQIDGEPLDQIKEIKVSILPKYICIAVP